MAFTTRVRRIHTVHVIPESIVGSLPLWNVFMPIVKWYFKQVFNFADVCIAISPHVEAVIKASGAKTEIVRINNPVMTENWFASTERKQQGKVLLGVDPNRFIVLGVGQLQGRKGVEDFIEMGSIFSGSHLRMGWW